MSLTADPYMPDVDSIYNCQRISPCGNFKLYGYRNDDRLQTILHHILKVCTVQTPLLVFTPNFLTPLPKHGNLP